MKRIIIIAIASLIVCSVAWASYFLGHQRGYREGLVLQASTYVCSLAALNNFRAGNIEGGTRIVEAMCFSAANIIYGDFVFRHDFVGEFTGKTIIADLQHYRQTYRTNSAEWTPMERSLEKNLASWRQR